MNRASLSHPLSPSLAFSLFPFRPFVILSFILCHSLLYLKFVMLSNVSKYPSNFLLEQNLITNFLYQKVFGIFHSFAFVTLLCADKIKTSNHRKVIIFLIFKMLMHLDKVKKINQKLGGTLPGIHLFALIGSSSGTAGAEPGCHCT